nr:MAG TPA: hypothetical protein [Caudoviricetes sp.]
MNRFPHPLSHHYLTPNTLNSFGFNPFHFEDIL